MRRADTRSRAMPDRRGYQPIMPLAGPPPTLLTAIELAAQREWITVTCAECGKVLCQAQPGSRVKLVCRRCKQDVIVNVA